MDNEDRIEDDSLAPNSDGAPEEAAPETQSREKSPWKAFILTGLIASLFGAAGGGYGVYSALKGNASNPNKAAQVDLTPLETKITNLSARLEAAEASAEKAAKRSAPKSKPVDLSGFEKRLDALEGAPSPEIDPAALTALQSAQADGFEWPDTSDLENRLSELETKLGDAPEASVPADILDRLEALEKRPRKAAPVKTTPILAFPKAAMLAAVEDNTEGGVFKKTLSRHVRVKDENAPLTLIEGIEADIAKGRLEMAAKKYERLPEPIRAAGQAWYDSVKASL